MLKRFNVLWTSSWEVGSLGYTLNDEYERYYQELFSTKWVNFVVGFSWEFSVAFVMHALLTCWRFKLTCFFMLLYEYDLNFFDNITDTQCFLLRCAVRLTDLRTAPSYNIAFGCTSCQNLKLSTTNTNLHLSLCTWNTYALFSDLL